MNVGKEVKQSQIFKYFLRGVAPLSLCRAPQKARPRKGFYGLDHNLYVKESYCDRSQGKVRGQNRAARISEYGKCKVEFLGRLMGSPQKVCIEREKVLVLSNGDNKAISHLLLLTTTSKVGPNLPYPQKATYIF